VVEGEVDAAPIGQAHHLLGQCLGMAVDHFARAVGKS
jgi:hypothetical protein